MALSSTLGRDSENPFDRRIGQTFRSPPAEPGVYLTELSESTGRKFEVFPVVVFPGWFIEQSDGSKRDIWVLEPKALPAFLEHARQRLSPEEVKLASSHLSRFIRSSEQARSRLK